jgi:hypothetical protein
LFDGTNEAGGEVKGRRRRGMLAVLAVLAALAMLVLNDDGHDDKIKLSSKPLQPLVKPGDKAVTDHLVHICKI